MKYTSVEEYLRLEQDSLEKHEYVKGDIVAMAGETEEHNHIVANLMREVGSFLKGKDCAVFPSDYRVSTPAGKNYFYPDASIVCGKTEKHPNVFDTLLNPIAIFEVMSEGTDNIDRATNFFIICRFLPSKNIYL